MSNQKFAKLVDVDFLGEENSKKHHTNDYRVMRITKDVKDGCLVVRRGDSFKLNFVFDKPLDKEILLAVSFEMRRIKTPAITTWPSKIRHHEKDLKRVQVEPTIPHNAGIGEYHLIVTLKERNNPNGPRKDFTISNVIYIIFNPWNPKDEAYIPNEQDRQHYVLMDRGSYYLMLSADPKTGPIPTKRDIAYDQFHPHIIRVVFHLLGAAANLNFEDYNDPVKVLRTLGMRTNFTTEGEAGFLKGEWGTIKDYTNPWEWSSVSQIAEQYIKNGYREAKYGQCYTFASVFTSFCRAIGIGARIVMSASSCNDYDDKGYMKFLTDEHYQQLPNEKQEHIPGSPNAVKDSAWNFHEFNEVWLRRDDLKKTFPKYAGADWQTIDSTPQAMYDTFKYKTPPEYREYVTGPMPRAAIKERDDAVPYDVSVIRRYVQCGQRSMYKDKVVETHDDVAAAYVYTWDAATGGYIDLQNHYKKDKWWGNLPKSRGLEADKQVNESKLFIERINCDNIYKAGESWKGNATIRNTDTKKTEGKVRVGAWLSDYTGKTLKSLEPKEVSMSFDGGESKTVEWCYEPTKYDLPTLGSGNTLNISIIATKGETVAIKQTRIPIACSAPKMNILSKPPYKAKDKIDIEMFFQNPFEKKLSEAEFIVGGGAIIQKIKIDNNEVAPKATVKAKAQIEVENHEKMNISVNFRSKEYQTETKTMELSNIQNVTKEHAKVNLESIVETKKKIPDLDEKDIELVEDQTF